MLLVNTNSEMIVSFSGGGTRAALSAITAMSKMNNLNINHDHIICISGGCWGAYHIAIHGIEESYNIMNQRSTIGDGMTRPMLSRLSVDKSCDAMDKWRDFIRDAIIAETSMKSTIFNGRWDRFSNQHKISASVGVRGGANGENIGLCMVDSRFRCHRQSGFDSFRYNQLYCDSIDNGKRIVHNNAGNILSLASSAYQGVNEFIGSTILMKDFYRKVGGYYSEIKIYDAGVDCNLPVDIQRARNRDSVTIMFDNSFDPNDREVGKCRIFWKSIGMDTTDQNPTGSFINGIKLMNRVSIRGRTYTTAEIKYFRVIQPSGGLGGLIVIIPFRLMDIHDRTKLMSKRASCELHPTQTLGNVNPYHAEKRSQIFANYGDFVHGCLKTIFNK
jgi:hypothetical protein